MSDSTLLNLTEQHFEAVKNKDIDKIINFYAESEDLLVFVEGPRWATHGFKNVSKGWRDFVDSAISVKKCLWAESVRIKETENSGFVAGVTELHVDINGDLKIIRFRGTFVFEKDAKGNWKVIHEHFSQPAEDPYGIGDWLKKD